jgi:hypothetical protein
MFNKGQTEALRMRCKGTATAVKPTKQLNITSHSNWSAIIIIIIIIIIIRTIIIIIIIIVQNLGHLLLYSLLDRPQPRITVSVFFWNDPYFSFPRFIIQRQLGQSISLYSFHVVFTIVPNNHVSLFHYI